MNCALAVLPLPSPKPALQRETPCPPGPLSNRPPGRLLLTLTQLNAAQSPEEGDGAGHLLVRHVSDPGDHLTSRCQMGLVVLLMMVDLRSCPWWAQVGKLLFFPGRMDIFRYGSGLKNIPFFSPTALRSLKKEKERREGGERRAEEKRQEDRQLNGKLFLNNRAGSAKQKPCGESMAQLFTLRPRS